MQLNRRTVTVALAGAATALAAQAPASAIDEARIAQVACGSFRVVQTGLPPHVRFHLAAFDPVTLRPVASADVRTGPRGTIDHVLRGSLAGLRRLVVDVERGREGGPEYGEAATDLHLHCGSALSREAGRTTTAPAARTIAPPTSDPATPAPRATNRWDASAVTAASVAALTLLSVLLAGVWVIRRRQAARR